MSLDELLIIWNNKFPRDRSYRKKYNIAFGSSEHRQISQIDVFLDGLEDQVYEKHMNLYKEEQEGLDSYKKTGQFLKDSQLGDKEFDKLFDDLKV